MQQGALELEEWWEMLEGLGGVVRVGNRWGLWLGGVWVGGWVRGGKVGEEMVEQRRAAKQRGKALQQQASGIHPPLPSKPV